MLEKRLELIPHDQDKVVCVLLPLVLLPAETDPVLEERHGKKNLDRSHSSSGSKIVLKLLTKVVAIHVGLSAIYVSQMGL